MITRHETYEHVSISRDAVFTGWLKRYLHRKGEPDYSLHMQTLFDFIIRHCEGLYNRVRVSEFPHTSYSSTYRE